eukprot:scaffold31846_cov107-Isochrysis_galbana.AAC.1
MWFLPTLLACSSGQEARVGLRPLQGLSIADRGFGWSVDMWFREISHPGGASDRQWGFGPGNRASRGRRAAPAECRLLLRGDPHQKGPHTPSDPNRCSRWWICWRCGAAPGLEVC